MMTSLSTFNAIPLAIEELQLSAQFKRYIYASRILRYSYDKEGQGGFL